MTELRPEPTEYQKRFKEGRKAAGGTLASVAEALGKTPQYVSQFEAGRTQFTVAQFLQACQALRLRTEWVLHGTGKMFEGEPAAPAKKVGRPARRSSGL